MLPTLTPKPRNTQQLRHPQGDRQPLAVRPLQRPRVSTAAQRAVCYGFSTLGGGRWWWTEKEGVSGPEGSEEGKWGEVVRIQEMRKPRMTRKGVKSRKCRNDERSKIKKQNRIWATKENRKETEQMEGRKQGSERDEWEGCEEGEREPGRGHQGTAELCKDISCECRGSGALCWSSVPTET